MENSANFPGSTASVDGCSDVVNKVFNLEMLREMILDYAIHDKGTVEISNVQSCRLVNKAWLQSTSKVLLKSQEPLFNFPIYQTFSGGEDTTGEVLNHFSRSVNQGARLEDHVPPHYIGMSEEAISLENSQGLQSLFAGFINCGTGLVRLKLGICKNQHFPLLHTNVSFPKLRYLMFVIKKSQLGTPSDFDDKIRFLQTILHSSYELKSFEFVILGGGPSNEQAPDSFGNLILPPSITEIDFFCLLNERALEILVKNPLPNLKKLKVSITGLSKDGILTSVLQNVGKTLEKFHIHDEYPAENIRDPTTFQLSLMEKLESWHLGNPFLELQGTPSSLERFLPALNELKLDNQTIPRFRKWVDTSCFLSVTTLHVCLSTEDREGLLPEDDMNINFDPPTMKALVRAFPNVRELCITCATIDLPDPALAVLWKMKNLTSLRIFIGNTVEIANSDVLDAVLIGVPLEGVSQLRKSPKLWEDFQDMNAPSIRNLTDLQTLTLTSYDNPCYHRISNLAFEFAFFEMPNLINLKLEGGFFPTKEMEAKWIKAGRTIKADYYLLKYFDFEDDESGGSTVDEEEDSD